MRIYPAIDLMQGECVRLVKGEFASKKIYSSFPLKVAQNFASKGFEFLHVIDLDGAKCGRFQQYPLIEALITTTPLKIQVGGGIRSETEITQLLNIGAERIIIGSLAVTDKQKVSSWLEKYGTQKIILALDVIVTDEPYVVTSGWQTVSNTSLQDLINFYQRFPNLEILCTDVSCDGLMKGPNFNLYELCLKRFPSLAILVSGGIQNIADIERCKKLPNVRGVILGTALYEAQLSCEELMSVN